MNPWYNPYAAFYGPYYGGVYNPYAAWYYGYRPFVPTYAPAGVLFVP